MAFRLWSACAALPHCSRCVRSERRERTGCARPRPERALCFARTLGGPWIRESRPWSLSGVAGNAGARHHGQCRAPI